MVTTLIVLFFVLIGVSRIVGGSKVALDVAFSIKNVQWEPGDAFNFDENAQCYDNCANYQGDILFSEARTDVDVIAPLEGKIDIQNYVTEDFDCEDGTHYYSTGTMAIRAGDYFCVLTRNGRYVKVHYLAVNPDSEFAWIRVD